MSKGSYSWAAACIDDYKPLDNTDKWDRCPNCSEYPRVWVFDNGNYAKCRCSYKYEEPQATAESITSACYKRGIPYEEYQEYLRKEWNEYCFNERVSLAAPEMLEALKIGRRAIGEHYAPDECYIIGPLTGNDYIDLVQCPACQFIHMYDAVIAKAEGRQP
jgi:hypothetical protein